MLFYLTCVPLSSSTLRYVAGVIRAHKKATGVRWRRLNCRQQALLTLAYLRKAETYADLAAGFGVSTAMVFRRVNETIDLLAAKAAGLTAALRRAHRDGADLVVVTGHWSKSTAWPPTGSSSPASTAVTASTCRQ